MYKKLGKYIRLVKKRNTDGSVQNLQGIKINKTFMPSVANVIGTDLTKYKVVSKNEFAYNPMHIGRDKVIPISFLEKEESIIVSPAYTVFEIIDKNILLPEYLMMWFRRSNFDRNAWFYTDTSIRGSLSWNDFREMKLPIPSPKKQQQIVDEYNVIVERIALNEKLNTKLEETAQAIYREWFVEFEFPNKNGKPYKSSGGEMVWCEELGKDVPKGWEMKVLGDVCEIIMGQSPLGKTYNENEDGEIFYQGRTEFNFRFPSIKTYTTEPKRMAKKNDILMSIRAPVGDLNITDFKCCIGRGIASLSSKSNQNSFLFYFLKELKEIFSISNGEGTVFGSINKDTLNTIKILVPANSVISFFEKNINKIDFKIYQICKENAKLEEMRELLLARMGV